MLIIGEKIEIDIFYKIKIKNERRKKRGGKLGKSLACIAFLKIFTSKRFNICKHLVL